MDLLLSVLTQLGLFVLLALSLSLVFGVSRVVNLAVGDFAAIGGFAMVATAQAPFAARILVALLVAAPLLFAMERWLLRRIAADPLGSLLTTWGIGMLIRQACEVIWGSTAKRVPDPIEGTVVLAGTEYPATRLVLAAVSLAVAAVVLLVVYRTRAGLRIRAVSDNPTMASLLGTRPSLTRSVTFVVAGLLAVLAGALYSPLLGVYPTMGFSILIPAFVALLLAKPGNFAGVAVATVIVVVLQVVLRRMFTDTLADALFYAVVLSAVAIRSIPTIRRLGTWLVRNPVFQRA